MIRTLWTTLIVVGLLLFPAVRPQVTAQEKEEAKPAEGAA